MPSSPVLLHIYVPLSCCIYTYPCLAAYILHLFSYFLVLSFLHPSTFNGNVLLPCFTASSLWTSLANTMPLCVCEPRPFCCSWSCETHVSNNEEMAFNYTEVLVYRSFTRRRGVSLVKGTAHGNKKPFGTKIKVNTCTSYFVLGRLKN